MEEFSGQRFSRCSSWILGLFFLWSILCLCNVFRYSILNQKILQDRSRRIAWRQGELPALRGTVYSSEGDILASSSLEFFLCFEYSKTGEILSVHLGRTVKDGDRISAEELQILQPLLMQYPGRFRIESREVRRGLEQLRKIEKKYQTQLQGKKGTFVVMLDRFGRYVPGTLKVITPQVPGKSVTLTPEEEKECGL